MFGGVDKHRDFAWQRAGFLSVDGYNGHEVANHVGEHVHKRLTFADNPAHAITSPPVGTPAALSLGHTLRNGSLDTL